MKNSSAPRPPKQQNKTMPIVYYIVKTQSSKNFMYSWIIDGSVKWYSCIEELGTVCGSVLSNHLTLDIANMSFNREVDKQTSSPCNELLISDLKKKKETSYLAMKRHETLYKHILKESSLKCSLIIIIWNSYKTRESKASGYHGESRGDRGWRGFSRVGVKLFCMMLW